MLGGFAGLYVRPSDDFLSRVVCEAEAKLVDFKPQELAIFLNALGRILSFSSSYKGKGGGGGGGKREGGGGGAYRPPRIFMEKARLLFQAKVSLSHTHPPTHPPTHRLQRAHFNHLLLLLIHPPTHPLLQIDTYTPQNLVNVIGSFPKLSYIPPPTFWEEGQGRGDRGGGDRGGGGGVLGAIERALPAFKPQELSTLINALCKLEHDVGPLFVRQLGDSAAKKMEFFSPQVPLHPPTDPPTHPPSLYGSWEMLLLRR